MSEVETREVTSLAEQLQEFVGKPYGTGSVGRDPVNMPMIRHLTDALGDRNPVYTDEEFAKNSVHGGIVAPATSLQVWTMPGLVPRSAEHDPGESVQSRLMGLLDGAGYVGVVATNCEQTYHRYIRPGDLLTVSSEVESITGPKKTGLGEGYFVTTLQTYRDQNGEVVGEMRFRILKFIPANVGSDNGQVSKTEGKPQGAPPPRDAAFFWKGVEAGELRIQRCTACGQLRHPPRPMCPNCRSLEWDYTVSTGLGEVYSFVVHHRPEVPGREHPFTVGLIELEEGTRIVGNVVDCPPGDVHVGMPVQIAFVPNSKGQTLPQWRPR